MPVVRIDAARFSKMVGSDRERILDRLPYLGLDIESVTRDSIRVEYSPNRPDFGTDFGIARALKGQMSKEMGLPRFSAPPSGISVTVDKKLAPIRPYIACVTAKGLRLGDEDVRQILSLQEDLHNGLGRRRKIAAIGIHDMDAIAPPLAYRAVGASFEFVPLGGGRRKTIKSILSDTPEGAAYGSSLKGTGPFPVITDSHGMVLSFPPIINGDATKVTSRTRNLFVDVTSTDARVGEDILAIMATTLAEAGGKLGTVKIGYPGGGRRTPDLEATKIPLDVDLVRSVLGLDLSRAEIIRDLAKSRLGVKGGKVIAPRYRVDLLHPVDVAEEVALGYGLDQIAPVYPPSGRPGSFNAFEGFLDSTSTVMAGAGMIELMTYELTDAGSLYSTFQRNTEQAISVQDPKSTEHSMLRDALIPTLLAALPENVRADYPQRVYEIGRIYRRAHRGVSESQHLGCLVAHSQSSFTEAKMYLESVCVTLGAGGVDAAASEHWAFAPGRCASIIVEGKVLGQVGEVKPEAVAAAGLGVPVAGFEIDLSLLYELLK